MLVIKVNLHEPIVIWKRYSKVTNSSGERSMIKLNGLTKEEVKEISKQTADSFFDYTYNSEDIGLVQYISTRENMFAYMNAIVTAAYNAGLIYTTSEKREGYLMLSGDGVGAVGFIDGLKMISAEKRALGGFSNMKRFIKACFSEGGTIETRMRKAKRKFIRIEMLVVRKEYQKQGFMKQMLDYTYKLAESRNVPVILDTDDKDKSLRYQHLGMKLDRIRTGGERFHMYDLVREV